MPLAVSTRQDQSFLWQPGETHLKQKTEIILPLFTVLLIYLSLLCQQLDRGTRLQSATTSHLRWMEDASLAQAGNFRGHCLWK